MCADQIGAAYGLCTSYYNAIHCQQEPEGQSKACAKIAKSFIQITGFNIDWLTASCPCYNATDLDTLIQACRDRMQPVACSDETDVVAIACEDGASLSYIAGAAEIVDNESPVNICVLVDNIDFMPNIVQVDIEPAELFACKRLVRAESGSCETETGSTNVIIALDTTQVKGKPPGFPASCS